LKIIEYGGSWVGHSNLITYQGKLRNLSSEFIPFARESSIHPTYDVVVVPSAAPFPTSSVVWILVTILIAAVRIFESSVRIAK
jgi:hypothetical protein